MNTEQELSLLLETNFANHCNNMQNNKILHLTLPLLLFATRLSKTGILDDIKEIEPCIVSCGGGLALRQENVKKMRGMGRIILLSASPETIYIHVKDSLSRPLLNGNMNIPYIKKLMDARIPKYLDAADTIIETDGLSLKEVAAKIADLYT